MAIRPGQGLSGDLKQPPGTCRSEDGEDDTVLAVWTERGVLCKGASQGDPIFSS